MKSKLLLCLALVLSSAVSNSAEADQTWTVDKKRAFVGQCLHDTNVFVINVPADKNPHRGMLPDEVKARWEQASRNGTILYLYPDGLPQGFFSNRQYQINGPAKSWYPNGQLAVDEQYDQGKLISGAYYDESGKLLGKMTKGTGRRLVWNRQRTGSRFTAECSVTEYRDGLKDGIETIYSDFAKGEKLSESYYKKGKQDGIQTSWDKGRRILETDFKDGLPDGLEIAWSSSGQTNHIGHYRNGRQNGSWITFLSDGTRHGETVYHMGKVSSNMVWFTNGVLMSEEFYTTKGMMARSYDFTGRQTGEVSAGNGTLVVATPALPGFEIEVYRGGKMVDERRLRLYARLVSDDAGISPSAKVVAFHLEVIVTDEPLKTFSAELHLPAGVTSGSKPFFAATNVEFHQFEPFDLKFPVPYQQWAGDISADVNMELPDCSIHSQSVVLHREKP
jgi:antitoxin component YwqK of YwqJK toxin-antitoxin module